MITHCGGLGKPLASELMLVEVLLKCKLCLGWVQYIGKGIPLVQVVYGLGTISWQGIALQLCVDWVLALELITVIFH